MAWRGASSSVAMQCCNWLSACRSTSCCNGDARSSARSCWRGWPSASVRCSGVSGLRLRIRSMARWRAMVVSQAMGPVRSWALRGACPHGQEGVLQHAFGRAPVAQHAPQDGQQAPAHQPVQRLQGLTVLQGHTRHQLLQLQVDIGGRGHGHQKTLWPTACGALRQRRLGDRRAPALPADWRHASRLHVHRHPHADPPART